MQSCVCVQISLVTYLKDKYDVMLNNKHFFSQPSKSCGTGCTPRHERRLTIVSYKTNNFLFPGWSAWEANPRPPAW